MKRLLLFCATTTLAGCALTRPAADLPALEQQVMATERAFAATMAKRDAEGFADFIDAEAVFFAGDEPLRGKQAVLDSWARYFEGPEAPFSWAPDQVVVLQSGTLALSTGPVHGPDGTLVARFNSIWRLQSPGIWKIVFDKGSPVARPPAGASP